MDKIVEEGSIHVKLHTKKPPLGGGFGESVL